jgi:hypothetical protein
MTQLEEKMLSLGLHKYWILLLELMMLTKLHFDLNHHGMHHRIAYHRLRHQHHQAQQHQDW